MDQPIMPLGYYQAQRKLAMELVDAGAVTISAPDGLFSVTTEKFTGSILATAARCMGYIQLIKNLSCDAVLGVPNTGEPLAKAVAHCLARKCVEMHIRHTGRRCIADVRGDGPGEVREVVVLDDQTKTGKLVAKTIEDLRQANVAAHHAIALFDWERGAAEVLKKKLVALHPVFTLNSLLDIYVETGRISHYTRATVGWRMAYVA